MSNLAEQKKYTYKDYARWNSDIRYELIDGVAYAMASPSQAHQDISRELSGRLWQFLRGKTCKMYNTFAVRLRVDSLDDTVTKARWYRKTGVKEYWIVDPNAKTVQVCILENGKYVIHDYNDDDIISVHQTARREAPCFSCGEERHEAFPFDFCKYL